MTATQLIPTQNFIKIGQTLFADFVLQTQGDS